MSVVEHHQVEAAKTLGVGDEVDGDDPPAGNRKAEHDTRPCAGSPHESRGSVHERRLCGAWDASDAWDAWGSLYECKNVRDVFPRTASGRSCTSWVDIAKPNPNLRPSLTMRVTGLSWSSPFDWPGCTQLPSGRVPSVPAHLFHHVRRNQSPSTDCLRGRR